MPNDGYLEQSVEERPTRWRRISRWLARKIDPSIAILESEHEQIKNTAGIDPLTGANNRRGLSQALSYAYLRGWKVLVVDVDDFKACNDAHGHIVGDKAIMWVASQIVKAIGAFDFSIRATFWRIGGDEFLLLFPEDKIKWLQVGIEGLINSPYDPRILPDGEELPENVSISVSTGIGDIDERLEYKSADQEMYRNKKDRRIYAPRSRM